MTLQQAVQGTLLLAAIASLVNALEMHRLERLRLIENVWPEHVLRASWGWRTMLLANGGMRRIAWLQTAGALGLIVAALLSPSLRGVAPPVTLLLLTCVWLTAHRVRGLFNGGSDGMLFTVLLGACVAALPNMPERVQQGGMLYIGAQLVLSYWRAALVKIRSREWYTGEALQAFLGIPAYAVPSWIPRRTGLLAFTGVIVLVGELTLPLLLLHPRGVLPFTAVALGFHTAVALLFGLNRFLLAWSAALPSVWYLHTLLHR